MQIPLIQKSNGMYLFCSKDFDSVAELVLREYAPYMLKKAQPLQIEALADEAYSLTILDRYLSASGSVLGMISFVSLVAFSLMTGVAAKIVEMLKRWYRGSASV